MIMITYNWKAEFEQNQLNRAETCQAIKDGLFDIGTIKELSDVNLIAEMANALDRYQNILNEMEEDNRTVKRKPDKDD